MKDGRRNNCIMGFIFWGFILLFFMLVYPQIFFAFIHSSSSADAYWYIKPGFIACLAIFLSILGVSATALVSSVLLYFTASFAYRKWRRLNITQYFSRLRTPRTKTTRTTDPKSRRRVSVPRDKDVKVLFSTFQRKTSQKRKFNNRFDANTSNSPHPADDPHPVNSPHPAGDPQPSNSPASGSIEVKLPLLDKGQQTSQACTATLGQQTSQACTVTLGQQTSQACTSTSGQQTSLDYIVTTAKTTSKENETSERKPEEKKMMLDVGVQAMRPDAIDPRTEGRINILESRLRLEELRNRAWSARMADTEECLSAMRIQIRKMQGTPTKRVVDQATNTSGEKLNTKDTRFQTPRMLETPPVREQGDYEALPVTEEPFLTQLYPKETKVYPSEKRPYHMEQKAYPTEQKVCPVEQKAYSTAQITYNMEQKVYSMEQKAYPIEQKFYPNEQVAYNVEQRMYPVEQKVYPIEQKMYPVEQKVYPIEQKMYPVEQKVYPIEQKMYPVEQKMYPVEQKMYPMEQKAYTMETNKYHSEPLVNLNEESKVTITEIKAYPTQPNLANVFVLEDNVYPVERKGYSTEMGINSTEPKVVEPTESQLSKNDAEAKRLALIKVGPAHLALTKVNPSDLALTKVDPAAQQVKPWTPPVPFAAPLPDDTIYSEDFNILLRRLRAEAGGEHTWDRTQTRTSQNNEQPSRESNNNSSRTINRSSKF